MELRTKGGGWQRAGDVGSPAPKQLPEGASPSDDCTCRASRVTLTQSPCVARATVACFSSMLAGRRCSASSSDLSRASFLSPGRLLAATPIVSARKPVHCLRRHPRRSADLRLDAPRGGNVARARSFRLRPPARPRRNPRLRPQPIVKCWLFVVIGISAWLVTPMDQLYAALPQLLDRPGHVLHCSVEAMSAYIFMIDLDG